MDNRFKHIITTINIRSDASLSVYDTYKMERLYQFYPATRILNDYGSAENFFTQLKIKGYTSLRLVYHLKSESGRTKTKKGLDINLTNEFTEYKTSKLSFKVEEVAVPDTTNKVPAIPQQNTFSNTFGFSTVQIIELLNTQKQSEELISENVRLKAENKSFKEQIENYKDAMLKEKFEFKKEVNSLKNSHSTVSQIIGSLPYILSLLNAPSKQEQNSSKILNYGSEVKNKLADVLHQIDDDSILFLMTILNNKKINPHFSHEMNLLMGKYNLWR